MNISITTSRLNEAFRYLKGLGKISTQKEIGDAIGSAPSNVSRAFKGDERYLTKGFLIRFNHAFGDIFNPDWLDGKDDVEKLRRKMDTTVMPCYYNETDRSFHANGDEWPSNQNEWFKVCDASYVKWNPFRSAIYNIVTDKRYDASKQMIRELWLDYNYSYNNGTDGDWQPPESITKNFLNADPEVTKVYRPIPKGNEGFRMVPLINIDSVGGIHSDNLITPSEQYIIKMLPFTEAIEGDVAILQSGNSMYPTIPSGSALLLREVETWREYFGYGNVYVLLLKDGRRITKEVRKYEEDPKNYVWCVSYNPDVADEELPRSMIRGVWKVIKYTTEFGW